MQTFTANVTKESKDTKLGIVLSKKGSNPDLYIKKIAEGSLLEDTGLVPGLQVLSINGQAVLGLTPKQAASILIEAQGEVTIVAQGTVATATKAAKDTKVGISLLKKWEIHGIAIQTIATDGILADSGLQVDQKVTAINGQECPAESITAVRLLKAAEGVITIVAVDVPKAPKPPGYVCASATKASKDASVGISLFKKVDMGGVIVIVTISDASLFQGSELKEGQKVVSINGVPCPSTTKEAIAIIKAAEGEVTIEAVDLPEPEQAPVVVAAAVAAAAPETHSPEKEKTEIVPVLEDDEGLIIVTVLKESTASTLGVMIKSGYKGKVIITDLVKGGLLYGTALMAGQQVVSINGTPCPSTSTETVARLRAVTGALTILARQTVATATKASQDSKVGITLGAVSYGVIVTNIAADGLFANSPLSVGQKVISINGQECPVSVKDAIAIVKDCEGALRFVAVDVVPGSSMTEPKPEPEDTSGHVTATANKESQDAILGISLVNKKSTPGNVYISHLEEDGLFSGSQLAVGQTVLSINGEACPPTVKEAVALLKAAQGGVTIVANNTVATAEKPEKDSKIGIALGQMDDYIMIYKIAKDGLFGKSNLHVGQKVVSINGEECPASSKDAIALVKDCEGKVTIIAVDVVKRPAPKPVEEPVVYEDLPEELEEGWVAASAAKESAESSVGLSLLGNQAKQTIVISKIQQDGPFADSDLRVGQKVIGINGKRCPPNVTEAVAVIKEVDGELTIVAANTVATVEKPEKESKVGISLTARNGVVVVNSLNPTGLFADSKLIAGQKVVSINGKDCPESSKDAITMIRDCEGSLCIVAVDVVVRKSKPMVLDETEGQVTVTVKKESRESTVGLSVMRSMQDRIVVSKIDENSLFASTELQEGQVVLSINGTPCPLTNKEAVALIKEAEGELTVVAASTVAAVEKVKKDDTLGISFGKSILVPGWVVVFNIDKAGLFAKSDLRVGQKVVSINGQDCPGTSKEAVDLLRECEGELKIVAVDFIERVPSTEVSTTKAAPVVVAALADVEKEEPVAEKESATAAATAAEKEEPAEKAESAEAKEEEAKEEITEIAPTAAQTVASVEKAEKSSTVGISLGKTGGMIVIKNISQTGLFVESELKAGQQVISINGKECPDNVKDAIALVKEAEGTLTVVAVDVVVDHDEIMPSVSAGIITATAERAAKDTSVGVGLKKVNGEITITTIAEDGLFSKSDLKVGQKVVSINGNACPSTAKEAIAIIKGTTGKLTITTADQLVVEGTSEKWIGSISTSKVLTQK